MDLLDALTDLRLSESFIEILVHRRLICSAHVELERQPSIYVDAIKIILPCLAILLQWDDEQDDRSVIIYHRVLKQLKPCVYSLSETDDLIDLTQLNSLPCVERQRWILKCLKIPLELQEGYEKIHSDYHLWLMILQYWYSSRCLRPVYLYGILISFVRSLYLVDITDRIYSEEIEPLSIPIDDQRNSLGIDSPVRRLITSKFKNMSKKLFDLKRFDCRIIHEFNCLQTIYMYSMKLNEFFNRPFDHRVEPDYFLCGSLFYAFVAHYEDKRNLSDAISDLLQKQAKLVATVEKLFQMIIAGVRC